MKHLSLQPLPGFRLNHWRTIEQIGTALSDLEARVITVDSSNIGNKKMTNVQLDRLLENQDKLTEKAIEEPVKDKFGLGK